MTLIDYHRAFAEAEEQAAAQAFQELDGLDPVAVLVRYRGELLEDLRIAYDEEIDAIVIEIM